MIDRAVRLLVLVAMAMEVAGRAAQDSLPADLDMCSVQAMDADSRDGKASMLPTPALTGATAPSAVPKTVGTGEFVSAQIGAERPGDTADRKTPVPESKDSAKVPDLRAFDGTADGFLRLPVQKLSAYSVLGSRVPVFRERDVYTKAGMVDLSFKRHPGLYLGNQFKLNEKRAYEMFMVDDWRATRSDYKDMARAMAIGDDRPESRMILDALDKEELQIGAEGENGYDLPSYDSFLAQHSGGGSSSLELTEIPVDFTVVRLKW